MEPMETTKIQRGVGEFDFGDGKVLRMDIYDAVYAVDEVLGAEANAADPLGAVCKWLAAHQVPGVTRTEADDFCCSLKAASEALKKNTAERHGLRVSME